MTPPNEISIREARHNLARALCAAGETPQEAIEQVEMALRAPGDQPATWRLHTLRGTLQSDSGRPTSALDSWLDALSEGAGEATAAYVAATELVETIPHAARGLSDGAIDRLHASALDGEQRAGVWLLLARIKLERREPHAAIKLLDRAISSGDEHAAYDANRLQAEALIEVGDATGARQHLEQLSYRDGEGGEEQTKLLRAKAEAESANYDEALRLLPDGDAADHRFVKALCALGHGDISAAKLAFLGSDWSLELRLLHTVAALIDEDWPLASEAVLQATSMEPTSLEVRLMRAQVHLQSGADIQGGLTLLRKVAADSHDVEHTRWIALHRRLAGDQPRFMFFLAELAAEIGATDARQTLEAVPRTSTTHAQDAAMDERLGSILESSDEVAAAAAYDSSVRNYEVALQLGRALEAARRTVEVLPTPDRSAALVGLLWRFSHEVDADIDIQSLLDEAAAVLAQGDDREDADLDRLCYLHGLVLDRKTQITTEQRIEKSWEAATWLLAAAIARSDAYRPMYLASCLDRTGANEAAVMMAEVAHATQPDDATREALIVTIANYSADLTRVEELLDEGFVQTDRYEDWSKAVRFHLGLANGRPALVELVEGADRFPGVWTQIALVEAEALTAGIGSVQEQLLAVERAAKATPGEEATAVWAALYLAKPEDARLRIEEGRERGNLTESSVAWLRAWVAFVEHPGRKRTRELEKLMSDQPRSQVLAALHVHTRILRDVYSDLGEHCDHVDATSRQALASPQPSRTIDEALRSASGVTEQVEALADLWAAASGDDQSIARLVRQLHGFEWPDRLGRLVDLGIRRIEETSRST